ncbi:MAG: glycosyltransferase family 4 protein [Acidobacteriota bacterium]
MASHAPVRKRALFLTPEIPALGQGGGALRSESLLQYLRGKYEVDVVTFGVSFDLRHHSKAPVARLLRNGFRLLRSKPPLFDRFSGYEAQIMVSIPSTHYDLAVIEHFWCASYAPLLRPLCDRLVLDLHNIESQLARTHAAALAGPSQWAMGRFAAMFSDLERKWLPHFDTLLVTSAADRARIQHQDIMVFPNALPEVSVPLVPESNALVFSGNMEYHPNIEAVRWFTQQVWPQVRKRIPDAEWRLVGRNPEAVEKLVAGVPGIRLMGPVDDAVAALAQGKICVVPLLSGSGTRFKILEAWAAERAVVSTTLGAEGLGAAPGEHLLLADEPAAFADTIVALWSDPQQRNRLGKAGRKLYEDRFTWAAAWRDLDEQGGL